MIEKRQGLIVGLLLFFTQYTSLGQDSTNWSLRGYVKGMYTGAESSYSEHFMQTGTLHGRLRFDFNPTERIAFRSDIRNRILKGDAVQMIPYYVDLMNDDPGMFDLNVTDQWDTDFIWVLNVDRLLMEYRTKSWIFTAGRQRINWGLSTVWNPHDVFNTFDFFDFDYEERPGSDAFRLQFDEGGLSGLEAAVSSDVDGQLRAAILYRFNNLNYDFQFLTGYSYGRWLGGLGWAGSIGETGFKGESRYVHTPYDTPFENKLVATVGLDRTFDPGWYVGVNGLYTGSDSRIGSESPLLSFSYDRALMVQVNRQINPIWIAGVSIFYASENRFALMPSISRSIGNNLEVLLTGIGFYETGISQNSMFLRLRWSFSS
ncbi:MAG: hypothetical protein ACK5C5_03065 [Bacteroidota bacterium]|jgi:hypothetical protein